VSLDWPLDQPLIVDGAAAAGEQKRLVVAEARTWIGTPYHHAADVKGHGVDCAMLLVRIYCDLRLVDRFDPRPYTRDWFLHRNEERYLEFLLGRTKEVRNPDLGGVIVFKIGRCFAHAGIISRLEPLSIIHAFANAGRVIEDIVSASAELSSRPKKFASFWG
jgi:cell wall-associated NlpC family hydrolase